MRLPLLACLELYLQRYFFVAFFLFLTLLLVFFFPGQEKREPSCQLSLKSFMEFSCQFHRQVNTHTQKMLLFPSGCYCIAFICFVWCFILLGISGPDEDEWSWTHPHRLPKLYFMCTLSWVGSLSKCEVMLQLDCLKVNTAILQL